jgi:MurE/MurF fusion protein
MPANQIQSGIHPLALRDSIADQAAEWLASVMPKTARLCADSRRIQPGDVFIARAGKRSQATDHLQAAIHAGAAALLVDAGSSIDAPQPTNEYKNGFNTVPALQVPHLNQRCGMVASAFYGRPSMQLQLIAVTGTNGKSSVTSALGFALARSGMQTAVIGTLGLALFPAHCDLHFTPTWQNEETGGLTTPDAVDLQRLLANLRAMGIKVVLLEASSIGLEQGRLQGCAIKAAAFTNLSHDHLDLHGSMQQYAKAKALLFESTTLGAVVINTDDPYGKDMWHAVNCRADRIAVGHHAPENATASLRATAAHSELNGWLIDIDGRGTARELSGRVQLPVYGRHNIENALITAGVMLAMDLKAADIHARLSEFYLPPGRLQMVRSPEASGPWACVDYAHSPDALARALEGMRLVADQRSGRLLCVFGCGGDRDTAKRPLMGEVAARIADAVVLTSDNPRSEPPQIILEDILRGVPAALLNKVTTMSDRGQAIAQAIGQAQAHDLVLIAGKGHETSQLIAGQSIPFSDVDHAMNAIVQWQATHPAGGAHA